MKRTTVPFMYNLDEKVEGLEVVDFPGVDDGDETISDLIDLFLTLSQIFIFVVDYRYTLHLSLAQLLYIPGIHFCLGTGVPRNSGEV